MKGRLLAGLTTLAVLAGWALPVQAQSADPAAVQQEIAEMRAQMRAMAQRIDTLEAQLAAAKAEAAKTPAAPNATAAATPAAPDNPAPSPPVKIAWNGAPRFSDDKGWSFKPRGRIQVDVGGIDAPAGLSGGANAHLGVSSEVRRARLGVEGTMPGGFGYKGEVDFADSTVQVIDLYLSYRPNQHLTLTVGQHTPFWDLDYLTSSLFTTNMERSSLTSAFGFERRVGLSAQYVGKGFVVQGGAFTDDIAALASDAAKSWSLDGRIVVMPRLAGGTLHLGLSGHWRELHGSTTGVRYSVRPFLHTSDVRFVDTGTFTATGEHAFGAELAWIRGRLHTVAESYWLTAPRPGLPDPTFNGGYAEVGYLLTADDTAYRNGAFDRIIPRHGVDQGGIGAIQLNGRYDWLDLNDSGIRGGRQQVASLSAVWIPIAYVRFIINYGHIWIDDSAVSAAGDRNFTADALGMRAQLDF